MIFRRKTVPVSNVRAGESIHLRMTHAGSGGIRSYQVLGERSSGTNYLDALVRANLELKQLPWVLGWKHGFPSAVGIPDDLLVFVIFRNAIPWVRSMYAKPWHADVKLRRTTFKKFIRSEWISSVDGGPMFRMKKDDPMVGNILQQDRHPLTGETFPNLLALRNAKIAGQLGYANRGANLVFCTLEGLKEDPDGFIRTVAEGFGVSRAKPFTNPEGRFGHPWEKREARLEMPPPDLTASDRAFVISQLDLGQEAQLGYHYG